MPPQTSTCDQVVDRANELQMLRDYVGVLPAASKLGSVWRFVKEQWYSLSERPPLLVYGPGGVGKSTLIAKFILDHVGSAGGPQLPFVYLDFDRPGISANSPLTLLMEAVRQLGAQFPEVEGKARRLVENIGHGLEREDSVQFTRGTVDVNWFIDVIRRDLDIWTLNKLLVISV